MKPVYQEFIGDFQKGDCLRTLNIPGTPIAKKRPRFARAGKFVRTYNDQATEEGRFLWEVKQQWHDQPKDGPIILSCRFLFARPKAHFGTGKNAGKLKKSAPMYHVQTPDLDNCIKFVKDCLNGVCWKDDCQVVKVKAFKAWHDESMTEIEVQGG